MPASRRQAIDTQFWTLPIGANCDFFIACSPRHSHDIFIPLLAQNLSHHLTKRRSETLSIPESWTRKVRMPMPVMTVWLPSPSNVAFDCDFDFWFDCPTLLRIAFHLLLEETPLVWQHLLSELLVSNPCLLVICLFEAYLVKTLSGLYYY